ncbi:MAG: hypothetical protein EHM33_33325 [Chloroflexi bacterium]|nr:MAG: hypothetical protein EHM33_33325 [Chloroflexota bacterium]
MITDEMVEKALEAAEDAYPESKRSDMRAALEAVAPLLIAQGLREAAEIATEEFDPWRFILARAQELDPK